MNKRGHEIKIEQKQENQENPIVFSTLESEYYNNTSWLSECPA